MYDYVASQKDYTLFKSDLGTYKITYNGKAVAHPTTEEQAFERLGLLSGVDQLKPSCWNWCRIQSCSDCVQYEYDE